MSTVNTSPQRYTLRDLPLPAKLVVTTFLCSVGIGYVWAMAQIHFKHASAGETLPTTEDLVTRFSGVPWPIEAKPDPAEAEMKKEVAAMAQVGVGQQIFAVKIKSVFMERCARCHKPGEEKADKPLHTYAGIAKYLEKTPQSPQGKMHRLLDDKPARRGKKFDGNDMSEAFFGESADWPDPENEKDDKGKKAALAKQAAEQPGREAERQAVLAWIVAGGDKAQYDADAFPLPPDDKFKELTARFRTTALAPAPGAAKPGVDKWAHAKARQLPIEALTQSTHAHLLTFSILWAATGLAFAFTSYSTFIRCVVSPIVLIAQVADVGCWWLARLEGVGPYFAIAIMATGGIVGLGLGAQIVLSIWNMYGCRGKMVIALLFLTGAGLFGLTYATVIHPQIQAEKKFAEKQGE